MGLLQANISGRYSIRITFFPFGFITFSEGTSTCVPTSSQPALWFPARYAPYLARFTEITRNEYNFLPSTFCAEFNYQSPVNFFLNASSEYDQAIIMNPPKTSCTAQQLAPSPRYLLTNCVLSLHIVFSVPSFLLFYEPSNLPAVTVYFGREDRNWTRAYGFETAAHPFSSSLMHSSLTCPFWDPPWNKRKIIQKIPAGISFCRSCRNFNHFSYLTS